MRLGAQRFTIKERMPVKRHFSFTGDLKVFETCPRQYQFFREYDFTTKDNKTGVQKFGFHFVQDDAWKHGYQGNSGPRRQKGAARRERRSPRPGRRQKSWPAARQRSGASSGFPLG